MSKSQTYLELYAPQIFDTVEEMEKFFENPENVNRMECGRGIVVRHSASDYVWGKNDKPVVCEKFDNGEFSTALTSEDTVTYKFAFCVDGREVCSAIWDGTYPKYIRSSIDLSNKRGKHEGEDISRLNFEQYLDYKISEGHVDLVNGLIKDICCVCSMSEKDSYTTVLEYGDYKYNNVPDYSLWVNPDGSKKSFAKK